MMNRDQLRESWRAFLINDDTRLGPWWMTWVWTVVFSAVCALGFTMLNISVNFTDETAHPSVWWRWYRVNLIVALAISATIRLLFVLSGKAIGKQRLRDWPRRWRSAYYTVVPFVGVWIAWPLTLKWVVGADLRHLISIDAPGSLFASVAFAILIMSVFMQFFQMKTRQIQAENRATEAQLRLLQAQIEPHFLFNTLANVVSLMQSDTPRAQAMLESFVDYLRASLAGFSHGSHTLGDEVDLVEAYMRIVKMRMEDRLHYAVDVPEALRKRALPALTLQPLVENAIVHGIEPQIAGGTIRIAARAEGGLLVLTVEDDGAGMATTAATPASAAGTRSAGTALANIRERLRQAYGAGAALQLDPVAPHGVRARLAVPAAA